MACTATTNPAAVQVTPNTTIHLTCLAHASYQQKVTASFNQNLSDPIAVFTGSGENVPMTSNGEKVVSAPTGSHAKLYVGFQYNSGGSYRPAVRVCEPQRTPPLTSVTSEDSTDSDDNDSYFFVIDTASR